MANNTFNTSNRGLAAAFMINGHRPLQAVRNDRDKPSLDFERTDSLMDVFGKYKDGTLVGNLAKFNEAMFEVGRLIRELQQ